MKRGSCYKIRIKKTMDQKTKNIRLRYIIHFLLTQWKNLVVIYSINITICNAMSGEICEKGDWAKTFLMEQQQYTAIHD